MTRQIFGYLPDGTPVELFTLTNATGTEIQATNYGATVVSCRTPDRDGCFGDIALGFNELGGYLGHGAYFGPIIGRYANRIAAGRFVLDGRTYTLAVNDEPNHLHGGLRGFDKVLWAAEELEHGVGVGVRFTRTSPDGEEGYPGKLDVQVEYTVTDSNELIVDYAAVTDAATPINLTQHTYFNLGGEGNGDILGHLLMISSNTYTPVLANLIPTGEIASITGSPLDFRRETAIGARLGLQHEQLRYARGYDHNYVINRPNSGLVLAARVFDPRSGRQLCVATTEPGIQFYSGNFLDGTLRGKSGKIYYRHAGFCLETQHFPDSPNHPHFPCTILRPGVRFASRTVFAFDVRANAS